MAAYGSGAVALSIREQTTVMNVDVGGGTSKIAVCAEGKVIDLTALDVGARLVVTARKPEALEALAMQVMLTAQPHFDPRKARGWVRRSLHGPQQATAFLTRWVAPAFSSMGIPWD